MGMPHRLVHMLVGVGLGPLVAVVCVLVMLVMNMAFLRKEEAVWIFTTPFTFFRGSQAKPAAQPAAAAAK